MSAEPNGSIGAAQLFKRWGDCDWFAWHTCRHEVERSVPGAFKSEVEALTAAERFRGSLVCEDLACARYFTSVQSRNMPGGSAQVEGV